MKIKRVLAALGLGVMAAAGLQAQSTLFFLEIQAVGAYSTASRSFEAFSLMPEEVMQKPSLGFDLVKRFSGRTRDIGVLAVQARLAYDQEGEHKVQPQLCNAFFRYKAGFADIWVGHSRPALGLSYALDSHANFEVGPEVRDAACTSLADASAFFVPHGSGKYLADLFALGRLALAQVGVDAVFGGGVCTYCDADRFYSHRRDRLTGRHAALIWLEA